MPRRKTTCKTSSARSTVTKPSNPKRLLLGAALIALACAPAAAAREAESPSLATIFAAYARATHDDPRPIETIGTVSGEGLRGTFHSWRDGNRERDDEQLGPRSETTLRIGDRTWLRNSNGNLHELTGVLLRRARTAAFVDASAFLHAPESASFAGFGTLNGRRTWNVAITAPGGDTETLWIDAQTGLPQRTEYVDGDGPAYVDVSDWRTIDGTPIPFRSVTTDGDHAFDTIAQTTSVTFAKAIDPLVFAPLTGSRLIADGAQTVPLADDGTRIACNVTIAGKAYTFLIDSGSGNILLDSRVARNAGLREAGALEVRGAARSGGMHVAVLPQLRIGTAALDDLVVSTIDLGAASSRLKIDGILGYPFFATSIVQLDFLHHVMRFGPPGSFVPSGDRIALDTDREIPEAVFRIDDTIDAPFIVDTGNSAGVLLYAPFVAQHPAYARAAGTGSSSFLGIGGADRSYSTRFDAFRLGSTTLVGERGDVIVAKNGAFADQIDAGNVGLAVLRTFTVTFDFADHALYLDRGTPPASHRRV